MAEQIDRAAFEAWVAENPGARDAYKKWSTGQPFRTDLATWHAFRAGAEWKSQTHPLGFQTRRAIKAEDELRAARNEIEGLNKLLNAAYVGPAHRALQSQAATRTLLEQYDLDQSPEYRKGYEDGRLKGYEVGHRYATEALQSQQAAAPTREVVFGGPEVRARMLEAGLPTADDHAKLAAGRGGVSPPHQAAADPDLTLLWLLINAWQEAKPPAFELVGKINGEVLRLVAAPPATPSAQPDWTAAARLIDASYQATKLKLLTGTSNWAAFICKMMAAPVPQTGPCVSKKGDSDTESGLSVTDDAQTFQSRVLPWLLECFGAEIACDTSERNHRFLEESLELVQSCGCTQSEAHQLVDYVFGRPVGDPPQEVGGVMVTLAALCLTQKLDMHNCGEVELSRIWTKVEQIRAKQAAKPKHSPLPTAPEAL